MIVRMRSSSSGVKLAPPIGPVQTISCSRYIGQISCRWLFCHAEGHDSHWAFSQTSLGLHYMYYSAAGKHGEPAIYPFLNAEIPFRFIWPVMVIHRHVIVISYVERLTMFAAAKNLKIKPRGHFKPPEACHVSSSSPGVGYWIRSLGKKRKLYSQRLRHPSKHCQGRAAPQKISSDCNVGRGLRSAAYQSKIRSFFFSPGCQAHTAIYSQPVVGVKLNQGINGAQELLPIEVRQKQGTWYL